MLFAMATWRGFIVPYFSSDLVEIEQANDSFLVSGAAPSVPATTYIMWAKHEENVFLLCLPIGTFFT